MFHFLGRLGCVEVASYNLCCSIASNILRFGFFWSRAFILRSRHSRLGSYEVRVMIWLCRIHSMQNKRTWGFCFYHMIFVSVHWLMLLTQFMDIDYTTDFKVRTVWLAKSRKVRSFNCEFKWWPKWQLSRLHKCLLSI